MKFKYIAVYEKTGTSSKFSPFTIMQTVMLCNSTLVDVNMYVHLIIIYIIYEYSPF